MYTQQNFSTEFFSLSLFLSLRESVTTVRTDTQVYQHFTQCVGYYTVTMHSEHIDYFLLKDLHILEGTVCENG
jgi:hypothetical protein